jgi:glycerol dehydrogenase-like iron-containing ADH family enzyme
MIDKALENACDTKACVIGEDVLEQVPFFFSEQFDGALDAIVVCDPRTKAAAGNRVAALLKDAGVAVREHVLEPGGQTLRLWGRSLTLDNPRSAKRFRGVV